MIRSMTGFASATGSMGAYQWSWEVRSVNGKGQDLRVRVPDWIGGLEAALRRKLAAKTARGTITLSLRLSRDDVTGAQKLNEPYLARILQMLTEVETQAQSVGVTLAPSRAVDVLAVRGVMEQVDESDDAAALSRALQEEADALLGSFDAMRRSEGEALEQLLSAQLQEIEAHAQQASELARARSGQQRETLQRNLARVLDNSNGADPDRVAQELAMLAVKADVTEEIDRLGAHVTAARTLISEGGAVGRKLDFLMQEFNREANTLCAKSQDTELTRCGLALKAAIDQMREQVQNVE